MTWRRLSWLMGLVVVYAGCSQSDPPPPPGPLPVWEPEAALLKELGTITEVHGYLVRPPKGHRKIISGGGPPGAKVVSWSLRRADGSSPAFQIMVGSPPPGERLPGLEEFLEVMLDGVRKRRQDWSQAEQERGTINGLTFLRTRWSATELNKGRKMHGVMYVAIDGRTFIELHAQDIEPYQEETVKIGEAAALTFKKK
jgi:hypothetical protein